MSELVKLTLIPSYIAHLKATEGLRLKAYKPAGERKSKYYTIGYGHYGITDNTKVITQEEAEALLLADVEKAIKSVLALLGDELCTYISRSRFTSLVDFVFNLGPVALEKSTLLRMIKEDYSNPHIAKQFYRWKYSGGRILQGLVIRCQYRANLWLKDSNV